MMNAAGSFGAEVLDVQVVIAARGLTGSFESLLEDEIELLNEGLSKRATNDLLGGERPLLGQKVFGYRAEKSV